MLFKWILASYIGVHVNMPKDLDNPSKDDDARITTTTTTSSSPVPISRRQIQTVMDNCLSQLTNNYHDLKKKKKKKSKSHPHQQHVCNGATTTTDTDANIVVHHDLRLRRATKVDIPAMLDLVRDLAVYEKSTRDSLTVTPETYLQDAFGSSSSSSSNTEEQRQEQQRPLFYSILLESRTSPLKNIDKDPNYHQQDHHPDKHNSMEWSTVGQALWYVGYSTTFPQIGHFLYLEDLYVKPTYRGIGGGQLLLQAMAYLGQELRCTRLEWLVLDWNKPSIDFYRNVVGAKMVEGYLTMRFNPDGLQTFRKSRGEDTLSVAMIESDQDSRSKYASKSLAEDGCIHTVIHHCIQRNNRLFQEQNENNKLRIRRAKLDDAVTISSFLQTVADFTHDDDDMRSFDQCFHLLQDGWKDGIDSYFHGLILEKIEDTEVPVVLGVATWYVGYSSRGGKLVFLENMSVALEARTLGGEEILFYTLADIAAEWQCTRFEWRTYECNMSSPNMHDTRIGAHALRNCITMRLNKEGMGNFLHTLIQKS